MIQDAVPDGYIVPEMEFSANYRYEHYNNPGFTRLYLKSIKDGPSIPVLDNWMFSSGWMCFNCVSLKSKNDTISFEKGGFRTTSPDDIRFEDGTECDINGIKYVFDNKSWNLKK